MPSIVVPFTSLSLCSSIRPCELCTTAGTEESNKGAEEVHSRNTLRQADDNEPLSVSEGLGRNEAARCFEC